MQTTEGSQTDEKISGGTQTGSENGQDGATQTQEEEQDSDHLMCRRVSSRFRFSIAGDMEAVKAATIIQASYRDHRARRASMQAGTSSEIISHDSDVNRRKSMPANMSKVSISGGDSEREINNIVFKQHETSMSNIHESDPEKAATTIQAAFRGHITRQSIAAGSHPSLHRVEPQEDTVLEEEESSDYVVEEPQEEVSSPADPEE